MYVTKIPSFEVEEVGCRQSMRPPSILWFGGCCLSTHVALLTTYLRACCTSFRFYPNVPVHASKWLIPIPCSDHNEVLPSYCFINKSSFVSSTTWTAYLM